MLLQYVQCDSLLLKASFFLETNMINFTLSWHWIELKEALYDTHDHDPKPPTANFKTHIFTLIFGNIIFALLKHKKSNLMHENHQKPHAESVCQRFWVYSIMWPHGGAVAQ